MFVHIKGGRDSHNLYAIHDSSDMNFIKNDENKFYVLDASKSVCDSLIVRSCLTKIYKN
jgi:hypothetical protein